ncbi:MAG TPA: hypothetical protein VKR58_14770 [Aquella sp.]|nr:hypothetical protein [Aquella sp.]
MQVVSRQTVTYIRVTVGIMTHKLTYQKIINYGLIIVSLLSTLFILGYFILNINRGFNFLDEGFYLLGAAHPEDVRAQFSSYNNYAHLIMKLNDNIVFLRLIMLLLNVFSIFLLSFSLSGLIGKNDKRVIFLLFMPMLCVSFAGLIFPNVPNYNNFTIFGSIIFTSALVILFTTKNKKIADICLFLFGFFAVFVFFNKFSSGLILLFIAFITYFIYVIKNKEHSFRSLFYLIAGILLHVAIFFLFIQNFNQFILSYKMGFKFLKISQTNHSLSVLLQYYQQTRTLTLFSFKHYGIGICAAVFIIILQQIHYFFRIKTVSLFASYVLLISFFLIGYVTYVNINYDKFIVLASFYFSGLVLMLLISLINLGPTDWNKLKHVSFIKLLLILLLFMLPFIIAVGTANVIYMQVLLSIFVWMPIIIILASHGQKSIMNTFTYAVITGYCLISMYYSYTNLKETPYGLYGTLSMQTSLTNINNSQLYVDSTTKKIIDLTRNKLENCGFKPNDFLVNLTDIPGLTYAVHGRSPSYPWYSGMFKSSDELTKFYLSLSPDIKSPYILVTSFNGQVSKLAGNQLDNYFKNFSTRYKICGEVKNIPTDGGACCKAPIDNIKIFKPKS